MPDTKQPLPASRVEIYKGSDKKWRWRLISKADIRAESPQGYVSKQGCLIAIERVKMLMQDAILTEIKN